MPEPMFLVGLGVEFYVVRPEPSPAEAPEVFPPDPPEPPLLEPPPPQAASPAAAAAAVPVAMSVRRLRFTIRLQSILRTDSVRPAGFSLPDGEMLHCGEEIFAVLSLPFTSVRLVRWVSVGQ